MSKLMIGDIEINLVRKKVKNINLSVRPPNGEVHISAPFRVSDEKIRSFVLSKIKWIKQHQKKFRMQEKIKPFEYITGEEHYFLGNKYYLNIIYIDKNPSKVKKREKYIDLYVKQEHTRQKKEKLLKEWYREKLKEMIPPLVKKWEQVMGVKVCEFGVKQMKTRWGTCNVVARRIWINLELAKKPPHCLEYIVVHEMVHLLERSHNQKFTAYMDQFLPTWRSSEKDLL